MKNTIQQAMILWPEETLPSFKMDKSGTYVIDYEGGQTNYGDTLEEVLYHCAVDCRSAAIQTFGDGSKWNPVIELLSEFVVDPITEDVLKPLSEAEMGG